MAVVDVMTLDELKKLKEAQQRVYANSMFLGLDDQALLETLFRRLMKTAKLEALQALLNIHLSGALVDRDTIRNMQEILDV